MSLTSAPALKVTPKSVFIGDPKQLVDLLSSGVAQPILEIARTKANLPLYKAKLRCKTLFQGNLDVFFLADYPNQKISLIDIEGSPKEALISLATEEVDAEGAVNQERAKKYAFHLSLAINYWSVLMENEVKRVFPDKTPTHTDPFSSDSKLYLKISPFNKNFEFSRFISECNAKKGTPCFRIAYGWMMSKENDSGEEQNWGFKFELSPYAQYPYVPRTRKPVSSAVKQEQMLKKRKLIEEEEVSSAIVEPSVIEAVAK